MNARPGVESRPQPPGHGSWRGSRVCVTGGAGFIGSHLAEALVAEGAHVAVIDDLSGGRKANLAAVEGRIAFHHGSILDAAALVRAVAGCEIVFHQAAAVSVPESVEHPDRCFAINDEGTFAVLEAARREGVRRVIYAGSSSAYGSGPGAGSSRRGDRREGAAAEGRCAESMAPAPRSPYAASKLAGEAWVQGHCACYGLEAVTLRYFNVYGSRQRAQSAYAAVIPRFVAALRRGERPTIFGTGEQTRDFVSVSDVVQANLLAGSSPGAPQGEPINVGSGEGSSLLELLELLGELMRVPARPRFEPARPGDVLHSVASIERAARLLGYVPQVGLRRGLELLLEDAS
ncbi:MAG TPA: NAD-dependent epimerase/dehydratase family protein [Phycisphaerales bacterium]|nr:NAD-dependent epimerase/dehydratase family protein [Phycisphaerales bacterium]HMP38095.1 NAD-dependent epimerase/dehydratase family protein [Phycisphaerales bacterium]